MDEQQVFHVPPPPSVGRMGRGRIDTRVDYRSCAKRSLPVDSSKSSRDTTAVSPIDQLRKAAAPSSGRIRDRPTIVTSAVLLVLAIVAWGVVLSTRDQDMAMGMMPMSISHGLMFVAGWAVMMTAMMLPSALPMIALYGATLRGSADPARKAVPIAIFTLVYLAVWAATGVPVFFAQELLAALPQPMLAYG